MALWKIKGKKIWVAEDEDNPKYTPLCCLFEVIEKIVDSLSGKEKVKIRISNGYRNPEITIDRKEISEGGIIEELTTYGVSIFINDTTKEIVKSVLLDTETSAPTTMHHSRVGFVNIDGKEIFLNHKAYGDIPDWLSESTFVNEQLAPRGTLSDYRKFILMEIAENPKLSLALSLGVTAPVAHILKKHGVFYETLLWGFCGESSTGKTTSLLTMLSIFGNGHYLLSNLNSTGNALAAQISSQSGYPFVADEATRSKLDFDELIYSLSSGKGKRRCNGDGTLKDLVTFSGAAFFSSEQPILDKCTEQGGEEARVVEFELNWFDGDSQKAERFLRFFNKHHGVAIEPLARLFLDNNIQKKIANHFLKAQRKLAEKVRIKNGIDKRIVQRLAIIAVSCWLLQKAIKVDLHIDRLVHLLFEVFEDKQSRICRTDSESLLLQLFVEDYIANKSSYGDDPMIEKGTRHQRYILQYKQGSMRGMVSKFQGRDCLWLPVNVFNEILSRQSTYGASTAKRILHEKGHIQKFDKSYYRWQNFGPTSANAYCIFLPNTLQTHEEPIKLPQEDCLDIEPPKKLIAGFVGLTVQEHAMILNSTLAERLGLKKEKELYLHTWGAKDFLVLSTKKSDSAIRLNFQKADSSFVATDDRLSEILRISNLTIKGRERILFTDIDLQSQDSCAVIHISNPFGQYTDQIKDIAPYDIPNTSGSQSPLKIKNKQNKNLLENNN